MMKRFRFTVRLGSFLSAFCILLLWSGLAQARPKTDVVIFKNGDRLTCEIKKLNRGKLTVGTDAMGTIDIEWDKITEVESNFVFQVELQSGRLFFGSLHPLAEENRLVVATAVGTTALEYDRVVHITPIEATFWQRLDGSIDLGYSYTQDQSAIQWTLEAGTEYVTRKYTAAVDFSSLFKTQENAEDVNRQDLLLSLNWLLKNRWFTIGLNQFQTNASQGLDLRALLGGGFGRYLIQSNRTVVSLLAGLSVNRERYLNDEPFNTNVEAIIGSRFELFRFNFPEMDVSTTTLVFPSLTTLGRVRFQFNAKARFEILKDFYWSVSVFESYDSDPPTDGFRQNDFGVTTALGWSF